MKRENKLGLALFLIIIVTLLLAIIGGEEFGFWDYAVCFLFAFVGGILLAH